MFDIFKPLIQAKVNPLRQGCNYMQGMFKIQKLYA